MNILQSYPIINEENCKFFFFVFKTRGELGKSVKNNEAEIGDIFTKDKLLMVNNSTWSVFLKIILYLI